MSGAFTPGPWRVGSGVFARNTILVQGTVDTYAGPVWSVMARVELIEATDSDGRHWYAPGTAEANAHLIAAAPDMLEALQRARQFISNGVELGFIRMPDINTHDAAYLTLPAIDAALAKAQGAQS